MHQTYGNRTEGTYAQRISVEDCTFFRYHLEEEEKKFFFSVKKTYFTSERQLFGDIYCQSSRVSRNANSASIRKFESKPSSLNRVVPQVLCQKLIEYLFIFNQNMFLGLG